MSFEQNFFFHIGIHRGSMFVFGCVRQNVGHTWKNCFLKASFMPEISPPIIKCYLIVGGSRIILIKYVQIQAYCVNVNTSIVL